MSRGHTFIKHKDIDNQYDKSKIVFEVEDSDCTATELAEEFRLFMLACSYPAGAVLNAFKNVIEQYGEREATEKTVEELMENIAARKDNE